jgi:hypothetical protein
MTVWKLLLKLWAMGRCPRRRRCRPAVEELGPRIAPAQFRWDGKGDSVPGAWQIMNAAGAWVATQAVPGMNDDVVVDGTASNGNLNVKGGTLWKSLQVINNYLGQIVIEGAPGGGGGLELTGGGAMTCGAIFQGAGTWFNIKGTFNWSGGFIGGRGSTLNLEGKATVLNISGKAKHMEEELDVNGGATVNIQTLDQDLEIGPAVPGQYGMMIGKGSLVNVTMSEGNLRGLASNPIVNEGIFLFDTPASVTCELPMVNSGLLKIDQGTLIFPNAGSTSGYSVVDQGEGTVVLFAGAVLDATGGAGYNQIGGKLEVADAGQATLIGNVSVSGGLVVLDGAGGVGGPSGQLNILGNLTLVGTATYIAHVYPSSNKNDNLYVTGNITIGGQAALEVSTAGPAPAAGSTYDILWGVEGITGDFPAANKTFNPVSYTTSIVKDALGVGQHYELSMPVPAVGLADPGPQNNTEGNTVSVALQGSDATGGTVTFSAAGLPPGLALINGVITGQLDAGDAANGPFEVTLTATDGTYTASDLVEWKIAPAVTLPNPGDQTNTEGDTVSVALQGSDATGGTVTFSAAGLPPGLALINGVITGQLDAGDAANGPYQVSVLASDGTYSNTATFAWYVAPAVLLPDPGPQSNSEGDEVNLPLAGYDATGGTLSYSDTGLPGGLSIDPNSGDITGQIAVGAAGSYTTTVTASDGTYTSTLVLNWSVVPSGGDTTTLLSSPTNPAVAGQAVTLQASVSNQSGGIPTGTVTFFANGSVLGTAPVMAGLATLTTTALQVGDSSLVAAYWGDSNDSASFSAPLTEVVNLATTTTALTSSANPANSGQAVTFTAAITSQAGLIPTGTVTFYNDTSVLGTAPVLTGLATFTTSALPVGTDSITAVYGGDASNSGSSSSPLQEVIDTLGSTTTTLTASANPATAGQAVTLSAEITSQPGLIPTGTVTFYNGTTVLGTASVMADDAFLTTTALPVGSDSLTAVYSGDANNNGSSSAVLTEVVNLSQTMVMLSSSSNPAQAGQPVTFSADVSALAGVTPTGTITFYDGTTVLGTVSLNSMGMAALTVSDLAVGSHSVTAVYSGDATYSGSSSSALQEVIDGQMSMTGLTSSQNPAPSGTPVTFTASVSSMMGGTPTGQVQFWVLDPTTLLPVTLLGTGTLNGSGQASLTLSSLTSGSYLIEALYLGDSTFNSSSATLTQEIS